ncbi:MAG: glutathione S-transferase family protein [Pseudomonadota bacterium]
MTEIILHHFDPSPFAETVRLALGIKNLSWRSVQIPMIMPKPLLMPLSGGYRKTPIMQIGAEVYCDSNLILQELDRRFPEPELYPQQSLGLSAALASWSDVNFFQPGAALSMAINQDLPEPLVADRKAFFKFMDFDTIANEIPHLHTQFLAQVDLLEGQLAAGTPYLTGNNPNVVDILGYFPLWMARGNFPQLNDHLAQFSGVQQWEARMQQIGHGKPSEMEAEAALDRARQASPDGSELVHDDPLGLEVGQTVKVTPTDYGEVAVAGQLMQLSNQRVVIQREDPALGLVNNHFPRAGFRIDPL